tara:strand:- start:135 stop:1325 length:1191 start_codon:yes stop_codon:yes gene_type:complete
MYKTNLIVILLFFFLFSNAQEKDTICGKIKSLREELKFVNDSIQNRKLFSTEGDYGHYGFSSAEFTKSRFKSWWYDTYWVHYVNYYKEFDKSDRLLKEVWFYKNQDTVNYNEYEYNSSGKTKNRKYISYQESNSSYTYDIKNNLIFVKTISIDSSYSTEKYKYNEMDLVSNFEYFNSDYPKEIRRTEKYYDSIGNLIEIKNYDEYGADYGTLYEYDEKGRKTKVINHSPFIWVKTRRGRKQKRTKYGTDYVSKEFIYDEKDRIIKTHFYAQYNDVSNESYYSGKEIRKYDNSLLIDILSYDKNDSLNNYRKYEYDEKGRKIKESVGNPKYPDNNRKLEYSYDFYDLPIKLVYTEKGRRTEVDFEHEFDEKNNWIKQTKSVNGKKLFVWTRKIEYFE